MLFRFSLYGFLKNQRYFEPFFILFLLHKGLSFTQIGVLIAFREFSINLTEVPSGAFADLYGRKFSMILSFTAYLISFFIFAISSSYWQFFAAIFFFAIGDAFRTGTHKALIFSWLRLQDRISEKTKIYGYTRSWSKIGSAVSIVIATLIMLLAKDYDDLFYYAAIPYILGIINFITYPNSLDGEKKDEVAIHDFWKHFVTLIRKSVKIKALRNLILESMSYEGLFAAAKDYIQPLLKSLALTLPVFLALEDKSRTAVVVGIVYVILYIASAYASRNSHRIVKKFGSEEKGVKFVWRITSASYLLLVPLFYFELYLPAVILFIILFLMQNLWRPMQVSRFDEFATEQEGATILSIESQSKSLATMLIAPVLGLLVDLTINFNLGGDYWLIAVIGLVISAVFYFKK